MSVADSRARPHSPQRPEADTSFSALSRTLEDLEARLSRLTATKHPPGVETASATISPPAVSPRGPAPAAPPARRQALAAAASELALAGSLSAAKGRFDSSPRAENARGEPAAVRRLDVLAEEAASLNADAAALDLLRDLADEVKGLREEMSRGAATPDREPFELLRASFEDLKRVVAERAPPGQIGAEIFGILEDLAELTATNADQASLDALRAELEALAGLVDALAREETVLALGQRWDDFESRLADHVELDTDAKRDLRVELERLRASLRTMATEEMILAVQSRWDEFETLYLGNAARAERSLADALRGELDGLREHLEAVSAAVSGEALDARFQALEERVSPHRLEAGIARLSGRMDEVEQALSDLPDHAQLERVEQRVVALAKGMEAVLTAQQMPDLQHFAVLEDRLAEIAAAIQAEAERNAAGDRLPLQRLESRIESLTGRIDRLAENNDLGVMSQQIAALSERIEMVAGSSAMADLSERVAFLSDRFDAVVVELMQPRADERAFEARLAGLVSRIENAPSPRADDDVVRVLEAQIAKLSSHLDDTVGALTPDADPELGRRLLAIEQRLEESRDALLSAARNAAEDALRRTQESGLRRESEHVLQLAADLRTLESLCRDTDRRSASEFDSIQLTLVKIVERLTTIEQELVAEHASAGASARSAVDPSAKSAGDAKAAASLRKPAEPQGTGAAKGSDAQGLRASIARHLSRRGEATPREEAAAPGKPPVVEPPAAEPLAAEGPEPVVASPSIPSPSIPSLDASDALMSREVNRPMVPGSGAPDIAALLERVRRHQRGEAVPSTEPLAKADVITAARKAAAAAAAEAEALRSEPAADGDGGAPSRQLLSRRRKPILMAVGAVLLALLAIPAGYMFVEPALMTVAADTGTSRVEPAPAAQGPAASAGTPAAKPALSAAGPTRDATAKLAAALPLPAAASTPTSSATPLPAAPAGLARAAPLVQPTAMRAPNPLAAASLAPMSGLMAPRPLAGAAAPADAALLAAASAKLPPEASATPPVVSPEIGPEALLQAAAGGDRKALFEVGLRLMEGRAGEPSASAALPWFAQSAAKGFAPAQYSLGTLYEKGNGVSRDTVAARDWYTLAANQGNVRAMHNLAVLYATGIDKKSDPETAARWFTQAAEHGMRDSQYNLGILYARGAGVDTDLANSFKWFSVVAATGDRDAAAKKDEIAKSLSPADLARAQGEVDAWKPLPREDAANTVDVPASWNETADHTASIDMKRAIRNVQAILIKLGYDPGTPDGVAGAQTTEAIRAFQLANGLTASGEIDEPLIRALLKRKDA